MNLGLLGYMTVLILFYSNTYRVLIYLHFLPQIGYLNVIRSTRSNTYINHTLKFIGIWFHHWNRTSKLSGYLYTFTDKIIGIISTSHNCVIWKRNNLMYFLYHYIYVYIIYKHIILLHLGLCYILFISVPLMCN